MELTDAGNADRFAERMSEDLRYIGAEATWVIKRGDRWVAVENEVVVREMVDSIRAFRDASNDEVDRAFAAASLNHERIVAAIELAKAHIDLLVGVADLDGVVVGIEERG